MNTATHSNNAASAMQGAETATAAAAAPVAARHSAESAIEIELHPHPCQFAGAYAEMRHACIHRTIAAPSELDAAMRAALSMWGDYGYTIGHVVVAGERYTLEGRASRQMWILCSDGTRMDLSAANHLDNLRSDYGHTALAAPIEAAWARVIDGEPASWMPAGHALAAVLAAATADELRQAMSAAPLDSHREIFAARLREIEQAALEADRAERDALTVIVDGVSHPYSRQPDRRVGQIIAYPDSRHIHPDYRARTIRVDHVDYSGRITAYTRL